MATADELFQAWVAHAKHFAGGGAAPSTQGGGNVNVGDPSASDDLTRIVDPGGTFENHSDTYQAQAQPSQFSADLNTPQGYMQTAAGQAGQVNAQQTGFNQQLQNQVNGSGPSLAQNQFNKNNQQNMASAASGAASARGVNPALAQRMAGQNAAAMNNQAAGEAAQIRSQEQLGAEGMLGQNLQAQRAGSLQQFGNATSAYTSAQQMNQQTAAQNAELDMQGQQINAQTAAANAKSNQGMLGGLVGGAGSAMYQGGEVAHMASGGAPSSSLGIANGAQANPLGGIAMAILMSLLKGGKQKDATGAQVKNWTGPGAPWYMNPGNAKSATPSDAVSDKLQGPASVAPSMDLQEPSLGHSYFHPQSSISPGDLRAPSADVGYSQPGLGVDSSDGAFKTGSIADDLANTLHSGYSRGYGGPMNAQSESKPPADSSDAAFSSGSIADDIANSLHKGYSQGDGGPMNYDEGGSVLPLQENNTDTSLNPEAAPAAPAKDDNGIGGILSAVASIFERGGTVPGEPVVHHNSIKNDFVPAMLSPKEIVLPLDVTEADDAPRKAAEFVRHIKQQDEDGSYNEVLSKERQYRELKKQGLAEGGEPKVKGNFERFVEDYDVVHSPAASAYREVAPKVQHAMEWVKGKLGPQEAKKMAEGGAASGPPDLAMDPVTAATRLADKIYEGSGAGPYVREAVQGTVNPALDSAGQYVSPKTELALRALASGVAGNGAQLDKFSQSPRGYQAVEQMDRENPLPAWPEYHGYNPKSVSNAFTLGVLQNAPPTVLSDLTGRAVTGGAAAAMPQRVRVGGEAALGGAKPFVGGYEDIFPTRTSAAVDEYLARLVRGESPALSSVGEGRYLDDLAPTKFGKYPFESIPGHEPGLPPKELSAGNFEEMAPELREDSFSAGSNAKTKHMPHEGERSIAEGRTTGTGAAEREAIAKEVARKADYYLSLINKTKH